MLKRIYAIAILKVLLKEAIVWRQLNHDHILPFFGICESLLGMSESTVLVSPWIEAGDLAGFSKASQNVQYDGTEFVSHLSPHVSIYTAPPLSRFCKLRVVSNIFILRNHR